MKKAVVFVLLLAIVGYMGFSYFNNYIYQRKQADNRPAPTDYQGTLTGEYVCLPHKNTDGPQTLECAFGIKTDGGTYYGLDFGPTPDEAANVGDRITVSGTITPVEALSAIPIYPIEGVMRATTVTKVE